MYLAGSLVSHFRPFHTDDDGSNDQSSNEQQSQQPSAVDILDRYGRDALKLADKVATLERDNYKLRDRNRKLSSDAEKLKESVPQEGSIVLSADDAARWQAYTALGQPDELKTAVETAEKSGKALAKLERERMMRAAADAYGYNPAALAKLPSLAEKSITLKQETVDNKQITRAYVDETALDEYINKHDPEFVPSLAAEAAAHAKQQGTSFVKQPSTQGANSGDLVSQYLAAQEAQREKQPNPLSPTRA